MYPTLTEDSITQSTQSTKQKIFVLRHERGFDFAQEIFKSEHLPVGSCLKYVPQGEQTTFFSPKKPEIISLENGAFLSSEPSIDRGRKPLLGVIKPDGTILYYREGEIKSRELKFVPSDQYVKLNLTETVPFEVYLHNTEVRPINSNQPEKLVLLESREGEKFVKKRTEIYEEDLSLTAIKRSEIGLTAKVEADIFEAYCDKMLLGQYYSTDRNGVVSYVDRVLPYKGESLEKLLDVKNPRPLTAEQRIDIAKQCVLLIKALYDQKNSLSKSGKIYFHGQINLSHFCVLFKTNDEGESVPEVSLVGWKKYPNGGYLVRDLTGYMAPEVLLNGNSDARYRADAYSLGVVLNGFSNSIEVPKVKRREKRGAVHPLALRQDVEVSLLSNINLASLDGERRQDYVDLMVLARELTQYNPAQRPQWSELRLTEASQKTEKNSDDAKSAEEYAENLAYMRQIARKAVGIMKILSEHKRHGESDEKKSWLEWFGLGKSREEKPLKSAFSTPINNGQKEILFLELSDLLHAFIDTNPAQRSYFAACVYQALAAESRMSNKEKRECRGLIVELIAQSKPSSYQSMSKKDLEDEQFSSLVKAKPVSVDRDAGISQTKVVARR